MELHFISIYRVHGMSSLPDSIPQTVWKSNGAEALLTTDLEPFVDHADRATAVIHGIMAGLFGEQKPGTVEERLATGVAAIREERQKKHGNGVYLVFHATRPTGPVTADVSRNAGTFNVAFDAIDKKTVHAEYLPALLRALTAVVVGLDSKTTADLSKMTEISYLIDPTSTKPTYSVTVTGGSARVSLSSPLNDDTFSKIESSAAGLKSDTKITRVLDQFVQSLTGKFDDFRSFLSAWNALEIFVSSTFRQTYSERWLGVLKTGAPASANSYFDRLREIMSDRHRLVDKFVVIASLLNPAEAEADVAVFKTLKARRDAISHGADDAAERYPIEETQQLLRKYLRLHLGADAT